MVILPMVLYVAIRMAERQAWITGWFQQAGSVVVDLLCMPVVLGTALWTTRLISRRPDLWLPPSLAWFTFGAVSLTFEVFLPARSSVYTGDFLDMIWYALGTGGFLLRQVRQRKLMATV